MTSANTPVNFPFDNSYARDLPGFYTPWQPAPAPRPQLLFFNVGLAEELGLSLAPQDHALLAALFSGNQLPGGATPIAQMYAGHQFGGFSPQLGDGRALLLGELIDRHGRRRDMAFKGSGRTPFSRGGDGKAAIGPMLREVLIGEGMAALGIPTTRALAVVATGEQVWREGALPGANLTRIAASHLRVGTFEYFAARNDVARVRQLADYAIARHDPELSGQADRHLDFLRAVTQRQAKLVAQWMAVGFIHGVMNTDNMSIAGETIDYGPCAFMEAYDPGAVFSSIDANGRYAYENQPRIAQWNLARFAETLLPLLSDDEAQAVSRATEVVSGFMDHYHQAWLAQMRAKLGLVHHAASEDAGQDEADTALIKDWLKLLHTHQVDFTLAWRRLADAAAGNADPLRALFAAREAPDTWLARWHARCTCDGGADGATDGCSRAEAMRRRNPWLVPRNHRVEEALAAASEAGDLAPFEALLQALRHPFDEQLSRARFAEPASSAFTLNYQTFCGT